MSSPGCNPAASCCGGSTPPVRTSAVRERRNACLRRRAIHNDPLGPRSQTFGSAVVEREVSARRPSSATERGSKSGREAPPVRLVRHGDAFLVRDGRHRIAAALCSGTHADRSGGAGIGPRLPRLGRRTVAARARCGHALRRTLLGMKLWWRSASFAPRRSGFDSRRLHSSLRSVNGKHAPFVRPRCGFDSCRRLLPTPVAQWTERCSATAEAAGSTPAGRTTRGRSSDGRAPGRHPGEARSIRVVRSR